MTKEHQYRVEDDEEVTHAVVQAVVTLLDSEPCELPPLYGSVDPDALNAIFSLRDRPSQPQQMEVEFTYTEYEITIRNGTILHVSPVDEVDSRG